MRCIFSLSGISSGQFSFHSQIQFFSSTKAQLSSIFSAYWKQWEDFRIFWASAQSPCFTLQPGHSQVTQQSTLELFWYISHITFLLYKIIWVSFFFFFCIERNSLECADISSFSIGGSVSPTDLQVISSRYSIHYSVWDDVIYDRLPQLELARTVFRTIVPILAQ